MKEKTTISDFYRKAHLLPSPFLKKEANFLRLPQKDIDKIMESLRDSEFSCVFEKTRRVPIPVYRANIFVFLHYLTGYNYKLTSSVVDFKIGHPSSFAVWAVKTTLKTIELKNQYYEVSSLHTFLENETKKIKPKFCIEDFYNFVKNKY